MRGQASPLERVIEAVLTAGVLGSGGLLLAGLALEVDPLLRGGILLLMLTPVARVVVVSLGLVHERDWLFALVSVWILAVLASGIYVAARSERSPAPARGAERAP